MKIDGEARQRLRALVDEGAARLAARLGQISERPWTVSAVTLSANATLPPEGVLAPSDSEHYGAYFSLEGGAFLAVFHRKTGMIITQRLTEGASAEVQDLYKLESEAVCEAGTMLTSTFLAPFSQILEKELIVSAPKGMVGRRQELLGRALEKMKNPEDYLLRGNIGLACAELKADCSLVFFIGEVLLSRLAAKS